MHDDDEIAPEGVVLRKRRKGIYILPNLFTLAALFGGFYAVVMAMNGRFDLAAAGVFGAMVLDALDGRVARMTNTQSAFGEQMDSLSDMVSFGAAPGLIAYEWALKGLGRWGWIAAFVYCSCAMSSPGAASASKSSTLSSATPTGPPRYSEPDVLTMPSTMAEEIVSPRETGASGIVNVVGSSASVFGFAWYCPPRSSHGS